MVEYDNILCKRGGVKSRHCYQRPTLTSQLLTCTFIYRSLSTRKTGQRIVSTSVQLTFQCGVLCNRSCIVKSSDRLIRPPDIHVGGFMFYHGFFFFFLSFFFIRPLISELAERNSTKIGRMLGSNCDLKTHVQNLGLSLIHI